VSVESKVRDYLTLGWVPDAKIASEYLHQLFDARTTHAADTGQLMAEIVADLTAGSTDVAIPLSAGKDSRGLLGAALRTFTSRQVHCFTFGPDSSSDVKGARRASTRMGVDHHVVDPNLIRWDMAELTAEVERRLAGGGGIATIDAVALFRGLADAIPPEMPVLSGFLGDAVSGSHLAGGRRDIDHDQILDRFYRRNHAILVDRPDGLFRDFMHAHEKLKAGWPGLTTYDLLDFGFRQRLRIRWAAEAFNKVVRPYEDARWISHWFSKPVTDRVGQKAYDISLQRSFPALFPTPPLRERLRKWIKANEGAPLARLRRAATRQMLQRDPADHWSAKRGDPRRNASMAAVFEEASLAFDQRGLCADGCAMAAFESLMREPSESKFDQVRWFATAELLARVEGGRSQAE